MVNIMTGCHWSLKGWVDRMGTFIVKFRKFFMAAFLVLLIIAGVLQSQVQVNYDLTDYLPADSEFMAAYAISGEQFGTSSIIRVMVGEVSSIEAAAIRENLLAINAVETIVINDYDPAADAVLFTVTFKEGMTNAEAIAAIDEIRTSPEGKPVYLSGSLINHLAIQESSAAESLRTVLFLIPIILIILLLTSTSWIESLISLIVILVAIVISMGTNIIFVNGISFITKSILAALTMAISMDYSIFLLHAFKEARQRGLAPAPAMIAAIKSSFTTITVSSLTTVAGFAALLVMRFTLGGDMGMVFAKAILIALLTVLFLMPGLLMLSYRWIEKTAHKEWIPSFRKVGVFAVRYRLAILILAVVLVIPAVYGQYNNRFIYGASAMTESPESAVYQERQVIQTTFGTGNQIILLIPNEADLEQELSLFEALADVEYEGDIMLKPASKSYAKLLDTVRVSLAFVGLVSADIALNDLEVAIQDPSGVLMQAVAALSASAAADIATLVASKTTFMTDEYSRMFLELDASEEGERTFAMLDAIAEVADGYYDNESYLLGISVGAYSIKQAIEIDYIYVNLIAILAILIMIAVSFCSLAIPFLLMFVIEAGIFLNMSIPFFFGQSLTFVGYLIISAVQLGATIDYAILLSGKYMLFRKETDAKEAAVRAVALSAPSILTSGSVLTLSGLAMNLVSSNPLVQQIGSMVMRAGLFSMLLMFLLLPGLLVMADRFIRKTTRKSGFYPDNEKTGEDAAHAKNPVS